MHPRNFVFITLLALCHLQVSGQVLTNALPRRQPAIQSSLSSNAQSSQPFSGAAQSSSRPDDPLPDDPGQELLPVAKPEPQPAAGVPVSWSADTQTWAGHVVTLSGGVEIHYGGYTLRADKVVYNQLTTDLHADGHLLVTGGEEDAFIRADHGEMRLNEHTGRFFNVTGSLGVRTAGRTTVYSTPNPFLFSGRVLLQTGKGQYRVIDGAMTNCRLPHPDWQLIARSIRVSNGEASTANTFFKVHGVPVFYLPYLRHPVNQNGRESGLLIPVISNSSIKGLILGEQVYIALSRSTDMVLGAEYYSKRGFAPNGDFRFKGAGLNFLNVRWNALLDRGGPAIPPATGLVNQGGIDVVALGREDITPHTRLAGDVEYLSRYVYKLVFNDNYNQAVTSEVHSVLSLTDERHGYIPSAYLARLQAFASSTSGDEARILHLPTLRFDVLDRPLGASPLYWSFGSSLSYLSRSEPGFHARNIGRIDIYPRLSLPIHAGGWDFLPEVALRDTSYSGSQRPDLTGANRGTPSISHEPLNRSDLEASIDLRGPALERDFLLARWNRTLRHVIEPEFYYHFVGGIGPPARNVLIVDTTDIATDTSEAGFSLTQRFYLRPNKPVPCPPDAAGVRKPGSCPTPPREWASWQVAQKFFLNADFGGALIPGRRNVFDSTLDLTGVAFLTSPRNIAPITSRLRFEAIHNLRIEWDMDYDPRAGRIGADNLYAGYSWGRTTVGLRHALLNAVDENGVSASIIQSQQLQPFLQIGKPNQVGFNLSANGGYDFVHGALQYAGVQAIYNWNCCGISLGYRRFALGSVRDETQYLYSFTLANFGSVGDIRRSNTVFRDPSQPPAY
ncbi:MAG TPA: LPS assembly protein LptD [Terracidiphilus sp.]|nr:LPS assembly protein LptD [Terracidiphilus sp.]